MRYVLLLAALLIFATSAAHATGIHSTKPRTSHTQVVPASKRIETPANTPRGGTAQRPEAPTAR
ncbi:MAG: hypothetical protein QNJ98_03130 [Planctomycetota bacterium]|nr:hypothetical protein [Planctomycetota bacterium]